MEKKAPPSTKDRLSSIVQGFDSFDSEMKIGTRQRREKDEFKIAELKSEMKRLDEELTSEIKRRTEMNKSTQAWFEEQLLETNIKFRDILQAKSDQSIEKLDQLDERITTLGQYFEEEKASILEQIKHRGEELAMMLYKFKEESEVREREDDEIVEALNRYTIKLQSSLKLINSTDT